MSTFKMKMALLHTVAIRVECNDAVLGPETQCAD